MNEDELLQKTAESRQHDFIESFKNYGMLLGSMTPSELAVELGIVFHEPKQAAIVCMLMARIFALEARLGKD